MKGNGTQSGTEKQGPEGAQRGQGTEMFEPSLSATQGQNSKITPSRDGSPQAPLGQPQISPLNYLISIS